MSSPLQELLHAVPRAAALVDRHLRVIDSNAPFVALFGERTGQPVLAIAHGQHQDALARVFAFRPGWRGAELSLCAPDPVLCWCESHSLMEAGELKHFLELHPMEQLRALEADYLHSIRRVPDDRLWILDEAGTLLWARSDNVSFAHLIDGPSELLVLEEDRPMWRAALETAKTKPGETIEADVRAAADGASRYVDFCFIAGGLFGGRFYAASRSAEPSGCRIIRRLKEAWMVTEDAMLAEKLGTKQAAISRANKLEEVPPAWLIKTGKVTGISIDWLLSGQGPKRRIPTISPQMP